MSMIGGVEYDYAVLLQRQYPRWLNFIASILMIAGLVAIIYALYIGVFTAIR